MITIREAKNSDTSEIKKLLQSEKGNILPRTRKDILETNFLVAKYNETIIGCCSYEDYSPKIAEIRSLVVIEAFRTLGIGRKLVKEAIKRYSHRNQEVFVVTSTPEYFKEQGFMHEIEGKYILFKK